MRKTDVKAQSKWSIDRAHSVIGFTVKHFMVSQVKVKDFMISHVKGIFITFDANIYAYLNDFAIADIDFWIDANSISTGDRKRDEHLKSADFFDAQNHKQITFISKEIKKSYTSLNHELLGELTIKGITKNIKLNVEFGGMITDPLKNQRAGFTISGQIKRSDWGLAWNTVFETGGLMVSDDVTISCEVVLIKAAQNEMTRQVVPVEENNALDRIIIY